jgi:hypothetical protein
VVLLEPLAFDVGSKSSERRIIVCEVKDGGELEGMAAMIGAGNDPRAGPASGNTLLVSVPVVIYDSRDEVTKAVLCGIAGS